MLGPCVPRMKIMAFARSQWVRQPVHKASFSTHSVTGGALQLTAEKDPVYSIYATLPEEDTVINILELSENHKLMGFHIQTLEAYSAVCSRFSQRIKAHRQGILVALLLGAMYYGYFLMIHLFRITYTHWLPTKQPLAEFF